MLASLAACGNTSGGDTTTDGTSSAQDSSAASAPETTDPTLIPPEATDKYNGRTYHIFNGYHDLDWKYCSVEIYPEEMDGDVLNDALVKRCRDTEERLGIKIQVDNGTLDQIKNNISASDDFANVTYVDLSNIMSLVSQGYCVDFYDLPNIDLSKKWWDQNAEEKLSFSGHLYYTFNDHIFTQTENARAIYFNKPMAEELQTGDLYDLVRTGKWTLDKMYDLGKTAVADQNGDTVYDENDRYGICGTFVQLAESLLTGSDAEIIQKNSDGDPYFFCFTERFNTIYDKILGIMTKENVVNVKNADFTTGHALFCADAIIAATRFREMKDDFGILPVPKYDEAQEKYYSVSPNPHAMLIPVTVSDLDFTGAVTEELAYQSNKTLLPAYYENTLKGKTTRDDDSIEMIDLIHNNVSYTIKIIGTQFSDAIYSEMQKKSGNLASMLEKWNEKVHTQLEKELNRYKD